MIALTTRTPCVSSVVDDYPGIVELYDLALAARGFQVVGASTAGQAMTLAANEPFDAVVLDVELPDGSGPDLAEKLRQIPVAGDAPPSSACPAIPPAARRLLRRVPLQAAASQAAGDGAAAAARATAGARASLIQSLG